MTVDTIREVAILAAGTEAEFDAARDLCRGFQRFFTERLSPIIDLVNRYYPPEQFEEMLAALPQIHAAPRGAILLGMVDGAPMGCTMLRGLPEPEAAELKRMYVDPAARGTGLGRALLRAACARAKADGHAVLRLDTSYLQVEAQALYESEGFVRRGPYYDAPEDALPILVFMEKRL